MNKTEELRTPIRRVIEMARGQSQRATHLYVEDILQACKDSGLRFVDGREMDSWDSIWIKEIEL